jgi:hypothetical protein
MLPLPIIKLSITDSEANISQEDLCEWSESNINSAERHAIYKSFKPGLVNDVRVIPITPGDSNRSMSSKNKPLYIKNMRKNMQNEMLKEMK